LPPGTASQNDNPATDRFLSKNQLEKTSASRFQSEKAVLPGQLFFAIFLFWTKKKNA
jgi:hypothetical protein